MSAILKFDFKKRAEYSPTDFWVETKWELVGGIMMGFTQNFCGMIDILWREIIQRFLS